MKPLINAFLILLIFSGSFIVKAQKSQSKVNSLAIQQQLAEHNKSFTFRGKSIHPRAMQDLVSWVADPFAKFRFK